MEYPDARILVFAKAPVPGYAKTRLIPALGETQAARLQRELTALTLDIASRANLCPVELWCTPDCEHEFFTHCRTNYNVTLHLQQGHDLGQRMAQALAAALARSRHAVLIGTDNRDLNISYLREAIRTLTGKKDVVIGPSADGGYVLIGSNRLIPELLSNMHWSNDRVMDTTRRRLEQLAIAWHELGICHDIDRPDDLGNLPAPLATIFARQLEKYRAT